MCFLLDINAKKKPLREAALQAASRLFVERGYAGTNMHDIAEALGISRPALYYHFGSKEAILSALVEEIMVAAKLQSEAATTRADADAGEVLRQQLTQHAKLVLTHASGFRVLEAAGRHLPRRAQKTGARARRAFLDNVTATIARGIESGRFRTTDPRIAAFALIGMCNWTAWWFMAGGRKSIDEVAHELAVLGLNALSAKPPRLDSSRLARAVNALDEELGRLKRLLKG